MKPSALGALSAESGRARVDPRSREVLTGSAARARSVHPAAKTRANTTMVRVVMGGVDRDEVLGSIVTALSKASAAYHCRDRTWPESRSCCQWPKGPAVPWSWELTWA